MGSSCSCINVPKPKHHCINEATSTNRCRNSIHVSQSLCGEQKSSRTRLEFLQYAYDDLVHMGFAKKSLNFGQNIQIHHDEKMMIMGYLRSITSDYINIPKLIITMYTFYYCSTIDSVILTCDESKHLINMLGKQLNQIQFRLDLLYRFSENGQKIKTFHELCNNKSSTVCIFQSDFNHIFKTFTSIPWQSNNRWKRDESAFLFLLMSQFGDKPKIISLKQKRKNAIYHNSINNNSKSWSKISETNINHNNINGNALCKTKYNKYKQQTGKSYFFCLKEYEVFAIS